MRQSKDRYAVVFGTSIVAITFFLILDIQTGLNLSGNILPIPESLNEIPNQVENEQNSKGEKELKDTNSEYNNEEIKAFDTFMALKQNLGQQ